MNSRSDVYINHLDWHIHNLRHIIQNPCLGLLSFNANVNLDIAKERRKDLILEDILYSQHRKQDLDLIFVKHRKSIIDIMAWIKGVNKNLSKIHNISITMKWATEADKQTAETQAEDHLQVYYKAYDEFMETIPEYQATF